MGTKIYRALLAALAAEPQPAQVTDEHLELAGIFIRRIAVRASALLRLT
jgi:hypothetical protein